MKLNYFNFKPFGNKVLMTNDFGRYIAVSQDEFKSIVSKNIDLNSELGKRLLSSQMIYDDTDLAYSSRYRYELREMKHHINSATSLHIFVVTTACNLKCIYCQANSPNSGTHYMMDLEAAEKAVDISLQSPSQFLSYEFQGGEPLLNFNTVKHIVEYAEMRKGNHMISYNIVTNLTLLTEEMVAFFAEYQFDVSTSIDGSRQMHDNNRPEINGKGSFCNVQASIRKLRDAGIHVGAIETTTRDNLAYPKDLVNAYVDMGFGEIFIRPLTPLGKANDNWDTIGYTADEFLSFYKAAMRELIQINKEGVYLKENHASIFLKRIFGVRINYMELRSPCGAGIGQMAYYADGNVFTCDEGRMFYEMGHDTFRIGNVYENTYEQMVSSSTCRTVCASSVLESLPSCCDCVYQPYCGVCPVVNYSADLDIIEKKPHGYRCKIYRGILDYLFSILLGEDCDAISVFKSWIN